LSSPAETDGPPSVVGSARVTEPLRDPAKFNGFPPPKRASGSSLARPAPQWKYYSTAADLPNGLPASQLSWGRGAQLNSTPGATTGTTRRNRADDRTSTGTVYPFSGSCTRYRVHSDAFCQQPVCPRSSSRGCEGLLARRYAASEKRQRAAPNGGHFSRLFPTDRVGASRQFPVTERPTAGGDHQMSGWNMDAPQDLLWRVNGSTARHEGMVQSGRLRHVAHE
jgi:hypothetical protein